MIIKKGIKINNIELSGPFYRKYFNIEFGYRTEKVYLMINNDLMLSRVFVVNDNNKPIQISKDNLVLLYWIDCSTCDIAYDIRIFGENFTKYFVRDIFLIVNDKDYEFITEKVSLGVFDPFDEEEKDE